MGGTGTNGYIYGLLGMTVEQINNTTGTATYLHHDQQGSTRLLTGSTGTATGTTPTTRPMATTRVNHSTGDDHPEVLCVDPAPLTVGE
jgi:hypothetical protein